MKTFSVVAISFLLQSCTLHIIDDTQDYDISGSLESDDCKVEVKRVEAKSSGNKKADVK